MTRSARNRKSPMVTPTVLTLGLDLDEARQLLAIADVFDPSDEHPNLVVMSGAVYDRMVDDRDEREAIVAYGATRDEETLPHAMVKRLAAGESAIRVWREHRDMTLEQLGNAVGKHKGYLSEIESGKKTGTVETLRAIAAALRVDLEDIA